MKFKSASSNPRVKSFNPRVTSLNPRVRSLNPRVQETLNPWKLMNTAPGKLNFKWLLSGTVSLSTSY